MKSCKSRDGFVMIIVIFLILLIGTVFVLLADTSNTMATQTSAIYKAAVKSNLAAGEAELKKTPGHPRATEVSP